MAPPLSPKGRPRDARDGEPAMLYADDLHRGVHPRASPSSPVRNIARPLRRSRVRPPPSDHRLLLLHRRFAASVFAALVLRPLPPAFPTSSLRLGPTKRPPNPRPDGRCLTRPGEGGDFLHQLLPLCVRTVVIVLTGPLAAAAGLRLTGRALGGRARRQQGDLIDDVLHLVGERVRLLADLRAASVDASELLLLMLMLTLLNGLETRAVRQRFGMATPFAHGDVGTRRRAGFAERADVARLHEAQGAATLLIAEVAGTLVRQQRRLLRIRAAATAAHEAQLGLRLATVLRRPVLIGAARRGRQAHRLQAGVVWVLL